jgi:transposase
LRIGWSHVRMSRMGIYSKDLRIRAVAAVVRGLPRREILETFSISLTTLKRWLRMMSSEGKEGLSPGVCTGPRQRILATLEEKKASLWSQLQENDDDDATTTTVERHCELWNQGTAVAVCR